MTWRKYHVFVGMLAALLAAGCKTQYVPVVERHTEHHWHTDSVRQVDSVLSEKTTLIREADSATMARYGISLRQAERAWLVETDRLERDISRMENRKSDTVHIVDSVPRIVVREVERNTGIRQRISAFFADAIICVIIFVLVLFCFKLKW